jgi:uncharacterized OsmC-like protein
MRFDRRKPSDASNAPSCVLSRQGVRRENSRERETNMAIKARLERKGITPKDVERAIKLSTTKYCSATASMTAPVETNYRIVEKEG